jgi:hypothetical protein
MPKKWAREKPLLEYSDAQSASYPVDIVHKAAGAWLLQLAYMEGRNILNYI